MEHKAQNSLRDKIRTSLTYCLPAGITDKEWEVIINNILSFAVSKEEIELKIGEIRAEKDTETYDTDTRFNSGIDFAIKLLQDLIKE